MAANTIELSVPLPRSLDTRIYLRLSTKAKSIVLFLSTASQDELASPVSLGSFVYALPNLDSVWPLLEGLTDMSKKFRRTVSLISPMTELSEEFWDNYDMHQARFRMAPE
ncbi:hypothetical protein FHETE_3375 [Fusarium heterosporum]|uniref:Uncharacterized protein n=1 Tax=Fusarium heterosporum TaxID=42747 RepID=A0A8H5TP55_FUSHE|nr:hypothetical protein FHETE_3375 [Fusarium heterosporum]